jgi:hypothetical protein
LVRMWSRIGHPAVLRLARSSTAATYNPRSRIGMLGDVGQLNAVGCRGN